MEWVRFLMRGWGVSQGRVGPDVAYKIKKRRSEERRGKWSWSCV